MPNFKAWKPLRMKHPSKRNNKVRRSRRSSKTMMTKAIMKMIQCFPIVIIATLDILDDGILNASIIYAGLEFIS